MNVSWFLNVAGLFLIAVGTLLLFLYLWKSPKFADHWLTPDGRRAYTKHRRLLIVAVGLLAAWLLLQYLSIVLL